MTTELKPRLCDLALYLQLLHSVTAIGGMLFLKHSTSCISKRLHLMLGVCWTPMETCDSVFLLIFGPVPREKGTGIILPAWLKVTHYPDQHNQQSSVHALLGDRGDRQYTATSTVFYNFTKLFVRVSGCSWPKGHQLHLISKQQINNQWWTLYLVLNLS